MDNLRAIQLSIEYLYRAVEIYGVENEEEFNDLFDSVFIGIEATPDDSVLLLGNSTNWWEILGVSQNATKQEIINGFKAMAKVHHPDAGGRSEQFQRIRKAYEEALK